MTVTGGGTNKNKLRINHFYFYFVFLKTFKNKKLKALLDALYFSLRPRLLSNAIATEGTVK